MFKLLNAEYDRELTNDYAYAINMEFLDIMDKLWNNLPTELQKYSIYKKRGKNKKGKFINTIMTIFENIILQDVFNYYKENYEDNPVASLIFDGLHISKELPDQTEKLNEITKKYGVTWAIKDFNNEIENMDIFINQEPPSYEQTYKKHSYEEVKKQFEKKHFMIRRPIGFVEQYGDNYHVYNSRDYQFAVGHHKYIDPSKGKLDKIPIFGKWVQDPEKREYERIDFYPDPSKCPENVFNTFKGFAYMDYKHEDFEYKNEAIELFEKQISIIVNHDEKVKDYFIKYFAHMFQKPTDIPGVALIMKSPEGWGKDLLTDLIGVLLGNDLMFKTEDMSHIFGKFNSSLKNKMLIHLNELTAKDGFGNKDSLKGKITADTLRIEEKNNLTPIEVNADSRRFVIVSADPVKPERSFHDSFRALQKDKDSLFTLMEYFMDYDLSGFDVRQIPDTEVAKNMKYRNTPFIYFFMEYLVEKDNYKELFDSDDLLEKEKLIIIKKSTFKREYELYCAEEGFPWQGISWNKQVIPLLNEIGCTTRKKIRFEDNPQFSVQFYKSVVTKALVNKIVEETDE
jgi:hypothetical protein